MALNFNQFSNPQAPVGANTIRDAYAAQPAGGGLWAGGFNGDQQAAKQGRPLPGGIIPVQPVNPPVRVNMPATPTFETPPYIPPIPGGGFQSGNTGAGLVASAFQPGSGQNWWSGTVPGQPQTTNKTLKLPRWPYAPINY